jgi:hypothetical protein
VLNNDFLKPFPQAQWIGIAYARTFYYWFISFIVCPCNISVAEFVVGKCQVCMMVTNTTQVALQQEYDNLQHYSQTKEDRGLYSANRQQADRFYKVIKKTTKYPLSIRNDLIRLEHDPSSIAEYWVRVPVKLAKGGLWIGLIKPYEPIPKDEDLRV